jgi:hypothetical protein
MVRQRRDLREEKMGRRIRRGLRPNLELFEPRVLLSAITDIQAANSLVAASGSSGSGTFPSSVSLGGNTLNQGPLLNANGTINNMAIAPTGTPKPGELKSLKFTARYVGPYSVVPGKTNTQALQTLIQGTGTANTMLHSDIQMRLVTPTNSSLPIGGVTSIFDRNINTNTVLGLDLSAPQSDVDNAGRPDVIPTMTIDANISSGAYVEGYSQGIITIRYIPGGRRTIPGAISQGTAIVTIHADIYSANASLLLRNTSLDP